MLRQVWFIGRKDIQYMLRERETLGWMFVMPVVFFFFIGTVTSNFGSRGGSQDRLALWSEGDTGLSRTSSEVISTALRTPPRSSQASDSRPLSGPTSRRPLSVSSAMSRSLPTLGSTIETMTAFSAT